MSESDDHCKLKISYSLPVANYRKKKQRCIQEEKNRKISKILPQINLVQPDDEEIAISNEVNETPLAELQTNTQLPSRHGKTLEDNNPSISLFPTNRLRNDSFKQFTERFRSFSMDIFRSIELAHDMAEVRNQKFTTATQTAAVQLYTMVNNKNETEFLNTEKQNDDLNVIIDENEKASNNSLKVPSNHDFEDKTLSSLSSSDNKTSIKSPIVSKNKSNQKFDSSYDKTMTNLNLNRNSLIEKRNKNEKMTQSLNKIKESEFQGKDVVDIKVRISNNKGFILDNIFYFSFMIHK